MAKLNIPDSILEDFCCSVCKHYLSCAPVQILPNGRSICNLCSLSSEEPTYRQLMFEAFLSKLAFPCQFKNYGCGKQLPFGQVKEHEDSCPFRVYICPVLPSGTCAWEGSTMQITDHFTKEHCNLVNEEAQFKLQVDQNQEGILMVTVDGVAFIIKYLYNAGTCNLRCDVRYLISNVQEGFYKIQLTSDLDCDSSITVKGGDCLSYNPYFYNMQDSKIFNLNNYMAVLGSPDCVTVAINPTVTKLDVVESVGQLTVDYKLLRSALCKTCRSYLIPPLYETSNGPACWCCKEKINYTKLLHNDCLVKVNFPCRWPCCEFVGKAKNLLKHESACQFRIFDCPDCYDTFTWRESLAHLQSHGHEYFTDALVYKMTFTKSYELKSIFTVKDNEFIFVRHKTDSITLTGTHFYKHKIYPVTIDNYVPNVKIQFEHAHCEIKSEIFTVNNTGSWYIVDYLPPCFTNDQELTVRIKI